MNPIVKFFERIIHMFDKDAFNAKVQEIATNHNVESPEELAKEVDAELAVKLQPVTDRLDVVEKALTDISNALTSGADATAQVAAAKAVADAVPPTTAGTGTGT